MQWWEVVRLSLSSFLEQHGVLASFIVILIEETGVPVPVPGDFLMLGVGVHARQGTVELWQALLVMELATLLGASILYVVAARAGRDLVYRYGRYIHLTPARLDQAERWLTHHGAAAIVAGRLTPGLRMATVIASGVFGVSPWRFLPSLALGAFLYILAYTLLGYFVGPPSCARWRASICRWVCSGPWFRWHSCCSGLRASAAGCTCERLPKLGSLTAATAGGMALLLAAWPP